MELNQFLQRAGQGTQANQNVRPAQVVAGEEGWNFGIQNPQGREQVMQQGLVVSGQDGSISIVPIPVSVPNSLPPGYNVAGPSNPGIMQGLSLRNQAVPTASQNAQTNGRNAEELELGSQAKPTQQNQQTPAAPRVLGMQGMLPSQLIVSYQGECWIFDNVSPQKVEAVLSQLHEQARPSEKGPVADTASPHNVAPVETHRTTPQSIQRQISLHRFREKRKERNYDRKVRYSVRKEVAQRMTRKNGQFASRDQLAAEDGVEGGMGSGPQEGGAGEPQCLHCGIARDATPMMRKGPAGPQTLCNACGLMWSNKGILRKLKSRNVVDDVVEGRLQVERSPAGPR
uniref:CCT domain-containing protein n=2 Tax=Picocystis salinarum TaxID=88271 RepID=A0A7S3XC18_9CHLO